MARAMGTNSAKVIQVIETKALKGLGTESDPVREIVQYWDLEGNPLASFDKHLVCSMIQHETEMVKRAISESQQDH